MRRIFIGVAASVLTVLGLAAFNGPVRAEGHHDGGNGWNRGEGQWGNSERHSWQGGNQEWREHQGYDRYRGDGYGQQRSYYYAPSSSYYVPYSTYNYGYSSPGYNSYGYSSPGYNSYGLGYQGSGFGFWLGN